jgi:hypothetical protein
MNRQGDSGKHKRITSLLGSKSLAWRDRLQTWFKCLGPHAADEFAQCVRWLELRV